MLKKKLRCSFVRDENTTEVGFVKFYNVTMTCKETDYLPGPISLVLCDKCNIPEELLDDKKRLQKTSLKAKAFKQLIVFRNQKNSSEDAISLNLPVACFCSSRKEEK